MEPSEGVPREHIEDLNAVRSLLQKRVLEREFPEGWGSGPASEEEGEPEA